MTSRSSQATNHCSYFQILALLKQHTVGTETRWSRALPAKTRQIKKNRSRGTSSVNTVPRLWTHRDSTWEAIHTSDTNMLQRHLRPLCAFLPGSFGVTHSSPPPPPPPNTKAHENLRAGQQSIKPRSDLPFGLCPQRP